MTPAKASQSGLNMDAIVVVPGIIPCACIIESATLTDKTLRLGLNHVSSPAVAEQLSRSSVTQAVLHIFVDDGHDKQHSHFKGSVSADSQSTFTLEITNPDKAQASQIQSLLQTRGGSTRHESASGGSLKQLYSQHCRRLLEQLLPEFIEGTLEGIESELEQAAELRNINRLKDMRFIFHSRQQKMLQDFQAQFQANQASFEPTSQSRPDAKELHLLEQHEFEEWLDLQSISTRVSKENNGLTFLLNQFMNQVFRTDITDANNPLAPRPLSICLQYAVDHLGIAWEHRHTIYQAWENALARVWSAAIRSLINDFRRAGLEALDITELPANWSLGKQPLDDGNVAAENGQTVADDQPQTHHTDAQTTTTSQSLFQLMALEDGQPGPGADWQAPNRQLTENLRPKRQQILARLKEDEPDIESLLRELANSDSGVADSLDPASVEKANLVDRIFAPLKTQHELSGALRNQLQMLRLPVFETLIEAPDFLNEDSHPARSIINDLMRICLAERASSKKLEETVASIIDEMIAMEAPDSELLDNVGQRLRQLVERQDQSFLRNSERLAKNLEGKERLRRTRRTAQKRLNALLGGKQVPNILLRLLEAGWEQLIVLSMLREGLDSRQCEELLDVVIQLQAWLSPDGISGELAFEKELESSVMLQFIERELKTVGDPARTRSVIDELSGILEGHSNADAAWVEAYGEAEETGEAVPEGLEGSRWVSRAKEIAVGDWAEVRLGSGEIRRMRLVWGGEESLRFVFLSPKGMSEVSYNFADFIRKLARGEAWLVKDGEVPFLDQSLFTVVEDIYKKLNFQATHDALTGCMHRHDFEKHAWQVINRARPESEDGGAALLVLDVDEFSVINASYGAEAGDALLKHVADLLQSECHLRFPDASTGRIGSNEFAIIFDSAATEDCLDFAETVRRHVEHEVFRYGTKEYQATVSISIRPITDAASSPGDLLNQASLSLRAAKKQGGNRIDVAPQVGEQPRVSSPQWVTEIDRTIRDGSLYLRAQPIVSLNSAHGQGKMYEILLGLKDQSGKEISPQGYIEAAEQFRRSTKVDLWVVSEVMAWMRKNPGVMDGIDTLNVNLSGSSLSDDGFMLGLESTLRSRPELARKLCFEVTETSAVANLHFASDFMRELKRLHCRFALDDFGTGLSSYAYLQKLPVDFVKIDGIFVRDITTNLTNYAMVRSINELCQFLGLQTIAEYVEDMETMETLREIQVQYGQGFGIAKPRRLDSLALQPEQTSS